MKINVKNGEKISNEMDKAQKLAFVRLANYYHVFSYTKKCEEKLSKILYKKDWKGIRFSIDVNAQNFPASYRGTPQSTQFLIERGSRDWFIVGISRLKTKPENHEIEIYQISEEQKSKIADFVLDPRRLRD